MNKREIRHICMAEDDPDDFYFFSKFLKEINENVKISWFQTCEDLLLFLKNGSDQPCLIVLDMNMPRMDGHSCLVSIKNEIALHHIPVIIFSTAGHPETISKAKLAGAYKYILKPYSLTDFKKIVQEILDTPLS